MHAPACRAVDWIKSVLGYTVHRWVLQGRKRLPAEMRCFDTAVVYVKGGDGGKGCVAFRREKHVPKGACCSGPGC